MTRFRDIWGAVNGYAPFETADSFDNVGLLIGDGDTPVSRCLVTLDVTLEAVEEAEEKGCQLILSHHPVIFHPLKRIPARSVPGRLLRAGIGVISAHTNLDKAGLNKALAGILGIRELAVLPGSEGCAGVGLPPEEGRTAIQLGQIFKEKLGLGGFRCYDAGGKVGRVALCCGGGGSLLGAALDAGADCYVTGDLKHDQVVAAANAGMSLLDLGHFETEAHFVELMTGLLRDRLPEVEFLPAQSCKPLFVYY